MNRVLTRLGAVLTVACGLTLWAGSVAGAHVTVRSNEAVQGGHAEVTFRVPSESDTARTVGVQIAFPADTPLASVSVLPHPGWRYTVTRSTVASPVPDGHGGQVTEAVSRLEWTAAGPETAIKPGEYEVFTVFVGPLPKADQVVFKVLQTYDDGQVVRWIDEPVAGGPEPEHPAAVLALTPAAGSNAAAVAPMGHTMPAAAPAGTGTAPVVWWVLAVVVVAALAAAGAVLVTIRTTRRRGGDESAA
ncbi:YcnI family protein [Actinophytocola sp.]|uniref:YcnI family copper-binding membrane protein n=1 Tax=Actinophytocola sp. TaxID=1872138 RepID=UPI002D7E46AD|nr:YcnI family protein [Actinophytocola sp.]HET9140651.1 YcnI family protein [Actinophytocola sp.]